MDNALNNPRFWRLELGDIFIKIVGVRFIIQLDAVKQRHLADLVQSQC